VRAAQAQPPLVADPLQNRRDGVGIDPVGPVALQPQQHRLVGAVAATGHGQRTVQFDVHACHAR
jgi:hypothetical protein